MGKHSIGFVALSLIVLSASAAWAEPANVFTSEDGQRLGSLMRSWSSTEEQIDALWNRAGVLKLDAAIGTWKFRNRTASSGVENNLFPNEIQIKPAGRDQVRAIVTLPGEKPSEVKAVFDSGADLLTLGELGAKISNDESVSVVVVSNGSSLAVYDRVVASAPSQADSPSPAGGRYK